MKRRKAAHKGAHRKAADHKAGGHKTAARKSPQLWPWLVVGAVLVATVLELRWQGRLWWCECGQWFLWTSAPRSPHTSQHLADPYTLTHVLHGVVFYGLCVWLVPRLSFAWQMTLSLAVESLWEVIENTEFSIRRYREATAALGYYGDSVINSLGDIVAAVLGVVLARYLGWRWSLVLFIVLELVLLAWIRDSLVLNILTWVFPSEAIKAWQTAK